MGETKRARRVTLNEKRQQEIYRAVSDEVMSARVEIARLLNGHPHGRAVDDILYRAQCKAASGALTAAGVSRG